MIGGSATQCQMANGMVIITWYKVQFTYHSQAVEMRHNNDSTINPPMPNTTTTIVGLFGSYDPKHKVASVSTTRYEKKRIISKPDVTTLNDDTARSGISRQI